MNDKRIHLAVAQGTAALIVAVLSVIAMASCSNKEGSDTPPESSEQRQERLNGGVEGTETLRHGDLSMTWIKDNRSIHKMPIERFTTGDGTSTSPSKRPDEVLSSISTFLAERDSMLMLFDTGLGGDASMLVTRLIQLGVRPDDVTHIFLTHLHPDHIGGMMDGDRAVFAGAQVFCSQAEYDYWMSLPDDEAAQQKHTMAAYASSLQLFDFGDILPGGVVSINAVGHTPGHTAFLVGDILVVGDIIHGETLQINDPSICATFDMDTAKAILSRKALIDFAADNSLRMAGMHLADKGFIAFD